MERLCSAIEKERLRRHLTHYAVADQVGVAYATYNLWRYRGSGMNGGAAVRVSAWLDCDLREFIRERADQIPEYRPRQRPRKRSQPSLAEARAV